MHARALSRLAGVVTAAWLASALVLFPVRLPAAATAESVASRLANVERLVERSSGARRIAASASEGAQAGRERARELWRAAREAYEAGRFDEANQRLAEATRQMFAAVRAVGAGRVKTQKQLHDFEKRADSIRVLREAMQRIGREKSAQLRTNQVAGTVDKMVREARGLVDTGRVEDGRRVLDAAYEMAKTTIEGLRGGETLVRSLNFATAEEEYHYEVDRNDTHQMLIKVLLSEKETSAGMLTMVNRFVDRAKALRSQADEQAGQGDHAGAVKVLEQSTKELVRAIRSAGIYIPG